MVIMMPVMDGYEATHEIRNSEKEDAKSIPIIAMTANAFDDDMKKSKTAGMGAHLSKPLDIQKMIEMKGYIEKKEYDLTGYERESLWVITQWLVLQ